MSSPSLEYSPNPDATPEAEIKALAAVYAFVLDRHHEKKAAENFPEGGG